MLFRSLITSSNLMVDGILTQRIAEQLTNGQILGVDASEKMIEAADALAKSKDTSAAQLQYAVLNCATLFDVVGNKELGMAPGAYTKIFSNAALHWYVQLSLSSLRRVSLILKIYIKYKTANCLCCRILCKPETRASVFEAIYKQIGRAHV